MEEHRGELPGACFFKFVSNVVMVTKHGEEFGRIPLASGLCVWLFTPEPEEELHPDPNPSEEASRPSGVLYAALTDFITVMIRNRDSNDCGRRGRA